MLLAYSLVSDCGRSLLRPVVWLALVNAGAYFAYQLHAKPASTAVGRATRGTWAWVKSIFVTPPPPSAATTSALSAEQQRSLLEFWWSSAVPGLVPRAVYDKAALSVFGSGGVPLPVYFAQFGHAALNILLLLALALVIRNHFRAPRAH